MSYPAHWRTQCDEHAAVATQWLNTHHSHAYAQLQYRSAPLQTSTMTMDINGRSCTSSKPSPAPSPSYLPTLPPRNVKRSFDVAFLVAPDERLARKQQEKLRLVATGSLLKSAAYDPPRCDAGRSAFTKVTSPRSLSPDHVHYPDSLSPAGSHSYHNGDFNVTQSSPVSPPTSKALTTYSSEYLEASVKHIKNVNFSGNIPVSVAENYKNAIAARNNIDSYLLKATNMSANHYGHKEMLSASKMLYPHHDAVAYSTLASAYPFAPTAPSLPSVAAVVSASLLPSTFAAFSLPAQNICAKCNISFRMTSDLVYHMRSHHKGDSLVADPLKRRRDQDKLKCPVCSESFRERHHLTRHMTAHQDKDGDYEDADDGGSARRGRK